MSNPLRDARKRHEWQVLASGQELNVEPKFGARLAFHERPLAGTRGTSWPIGSWLEARSAIGWVAAVVHFVRRAAVQRHVRPMFVVPADEQIEHSAERLASHGHHEQSRTAGLECQDESLDDGQAAVLADGPEARTDVATLAPNAYGVPTYGNAV